MAGNKKPRKRYNPNKKRGGLDASVSYQTTATVFAPLIRALESLRHEVIVANDVPMVRDWQGDLIPIAPLLREWSVWFERLKMDCSALRSLADKLDLDADLYESDLDRADAAMNEQIKRFASMTVRDVHEVNITHQISLLMDRSERSAA